MAHSSEQIISEIEEILGRPTVRLVETLREETRRAISNIDATSAEITLYATIAHPEASTTGVAKVVEWTGAELYGLIEPAVLGFNSSRSEERRVGKGCRCRLV